MPTAERARPWSSAARTSVRPVPDSRRNSGPSISHSGRIGAPAGSSVAASSSTPERICSAPGRPASTPAMPVASMPTARAVSVSCRSSNRCARRRVERGLGVGGSTLATPPRRAAASPGTGRRRPAAWPPRPAAGTPAPASRRRPRCPRAGRASRPAPAPAGRAPARRPAAPGPRPPPRLARPSRRRLAAAGPARRVDGQLRARSYAVAATACAPRPAARSPAVSSAAAAVSSGPSAACAEMPRPPVDVALGHRAGQRAVHRAPVARVGGGVHRRPDQRVGEPTRPDRIVTSPAARPRPPADVEPERRAGPGHHGQVAVAGRGDQQHGACPGRARRRVGRTGRDRAGTGTGTPGGRRQPAGSATARSSPAGCRRWAGAPARARRPGRGRRAGTSWPVPARSSPVSVSVGSPASSSAPGSPAARRQHEHRVGEQPAGGERQRPRRRPVQQLGVVDDHPERAVLALPASRLSIAAPTANRSATAPSAAPAPCRGPAPGARQPVEVGLRAEQLGQPAEGHALLGLGAGRTEHPDPVATALRPPAGPSCRSRPHP